MPITSQMNGQPLLQPPTRRLGLAGSSLMAITPRHKLALVEEVFFFVFVFGY
jgi:hypothetical protein